MVDIWIVSYFLAVSTKNLPLLSESLCCRTATGNNANVSEALAKGFPISIVPTLTYDRNALHPTLAILRTAPNLVLRKEECSFYRSCMVINKLHSLAVS